MQDHRHRNLKILRSSANPHFKVKTNTLLGLYEKYTVIKHVQISHYTVRLTLRYKSKRSEATKLDLELNPNLFSK